MENQVWLGNRRLAILDPGSAGQQPMVHPDKPDIVVTYNGEIYNYATLKTQLEEKGCRFRSHCDTELLLHAYSTWGTGLLSRIEGMFAFALYDASKKSLLLARDPVGQKPLYFHHGGGTFVFGSTSSEVRALCPSLSELCGTALCHVMTHGYVPSPLSIWKGIEVLPPGFFAVWSDGGLKKTRYWAPPEHLTDGRASSEEFSSMFREVCSEHMLSDVPVGLFLSGGLDSTTVARALADTGRTLQCFSLGFGNHPESEAKLAEDTARQLNFPIEIGEFSQSRFEPVRQVVAKSLAEPMAPSALLTLYAVAELAARKVKVVLSGDGADELFGGYPWYHKAGFSFRRWFASFTGASRADLQGIADKAAFDQFASRSLLHSHAVRISRRFLPHEANALCAPLSPGFGEEAMLAPLEEHYVPRLPAPRALQRIDLMTFCSGLVVPKVDRMAMANSLEVRSPFLDRRLIDWALSRRNERLEKGQEKKVLRNFLAGRVPDAILKHRKQGFGTRGVSPDYTILIREIENSRLIRDQILIPDFKKYADVRSNKLRKSRILTLASIATWYDAKMPD